MDRPLFLPLAVCTEPAIVGGKALGLARLMSAGFRVPPGLCVTTAVYRQCLAAAGIESDAAWHVAARGSKDDRVKLLERIRPAILQYVWPKDLRDRLHEEVGRLGFDATTRWAVRSSATNEDAAQASFAGVYRTRLAVSFDGISQAVQDLWASMWDERVFAYHAKSGAAAIAPAMAAAIQPMLDASAAGVAYSIHPVTGRSNQVVVNAVPGLASSLVDGVAAPDQYVVRQEPEPDHFTVLKREIAKKASAVRLGRSGLRQEPLPQDTGGRSSLTDDELIDLARLAKRVERDWQHPVDIEWAIDREGFWLLQARPVTVLPQSGAFTNDECEWSRTNFKETMPELPSPLGLSFLEKVLESFILEPYRRLGCRIPPGVSSARIVHGRPYINVTLMHSLVVQLGGDPSILAEQMGGQRIADPPQVERLGIRTLVRAGCLLMWRIRQAARRAPRWFATMKQMAVDHSQAQVRRLSLDDVTARLADISLQLDRQELTFGIAGGVTQCLQALGFLLPRWLGEGWRGLLNGALQGRAQAVSALQIIRLAELADCARREKHSSRVLQAESWNPTAFRTALQGTEFLRLFDRYMEDYGHRGVGESDIMSPRFADQPELILDVLLAQLRMPASQSSAEIVARQEAIRNEALDEIKRRFGWRLHRWAIFSWWYRRLCRYFALREANRHHLMYYASAGRNLLLRAGTLLAERGVIDEAHDMFFIRLDEQQELLSGSHWDWRAIVKTRKEERARHAKLAVTDRIRPGEVGWEQERDLGSAAGVLRGLPISAGSVVGPVRLVRSMADWGKVEAGDIIVAPVIDPGMAPLFGIASGLIAEMGGTLSHGAIIAREYGLPTIANVPGLVGRLKSGDWVSLDAERGEIVIQDQRGDSSVPASSTNHNRNT